MAYRFLLGFSILLAILGIACSKRAQAPAISNQEDDIACAPKIDLRLIAAALKDNPDDMEAAIKSGANVDAIVGGLGPPLVIATLGGNYRGVKLLLDNGAKVSAADSDGYTAILTASIFDRREIARLLLAKGADVNAVCEVKVKGDGTGKFTPLMIAKTKGYQDMVQLLTEAGAKE